MQGKRSANIQYLLQRADGSLAQVTDLSVIANILAVGGDVSDYSSTTDSLEALSDAIGAISTASPALASVLGALADVAATGAVSDAKTAMSMIKQIVTMLLNGTYGLGALDADLTTIINDLANGTDGLGALKALLDAIPTTMVGTDLAYLATSGATAEEFTGHIRHYGGEIFYVTKEGDDAEDGSSIHNSKLTIQNAIDAGSPGDGIVIKAGTYVENVVLNENSMELWPESGVIIDPATGVPLTVSGHYCRIVGDLAIDVPAGEAGMLVSGNYARISDSTIMNGGTGLKVTGSGGIYRNMATGLQTVYGYDIDGNQTRVYDSNTVGAGASIGFNIGGGADIGVIKGCSSVNRQTSGYTIETGCMNWTILNCSSGGGDGRWVDADMANVWSGFTFDDLAMKEQTFAAAGAASVNLFVITGTVLITEFTGHVSTVLANDIGNGYLKLYDGTNSLDITDSPGPSFSSIPAASFIHKVDDATVQIAIEDSSQVRLYEDATKFGEDPNFQVVANAGATTYIQFVNSGTATSGAIHWHCRWEPLSHDGFVAPYVAP